MLLHVYYLPTTKAVAGTFHRDNPHIDAIRAELEKAWSEAVRPASKARLSPYEGASVWRRDDGTVTLRRTVSVRYIEGTEETDTPLGVPGPEEPLNATPSAAMLALMADAAAWEAVQS